MKKTGAIIATVVTTLLCGLPGLGLACWGLVDVVTKTASPSGISTQDLLLGAFGYICGGTVLVLIPLVVGLVSLRKKPAPAPVTPANYIPPAQPVYTPPQAAPSQLIQPAPVAPQPVAVPGVDPAIQDLYSRLMALNRPTAPYRIMDGRAENVDLIAEWKIVDAQWYEIFAKANLTKVFRIYLKFDPAKKEVRAMDREYTLEWRAGVPSLSAAVSTFRGQQTSVSFGMGGGFTENAGPGIVYKYKFSTNELKKPIQEAIAASGWKYKGVAFGKL
jgi:hypothetical protein